MTMRPRATSSRISAASRSSRRATNSISGVITPLRAASSCVMENLLVAKPRPGFTVSCRRGHPAGGPAQRVPKSKHAVDQEQRQPQQEGVKHEDARSLHEIFQRVKDKK